MSENETAKVRIPKLYILDGEPKTGKTTAWREEFAGRPRTQRASSLLEAANWLVRGYDVVFDPDGKPFDYEVRTFEPWDKDSDEYRNARRAEIEAARLNRDLLVRDGEPVPDYLNQIADSDYE